MGFNSKFNMSNNSTNACNTVRSSHVWFIEGLAPLQIESVLKRIMMNGKGTSGPHLDIDNPMPDERITLHDLLLRDFGTDCLFGAAGAAPARIRPLIPNTEGRK
jgi:hypothetical protein